MAGLSIDEHFNCHLGEQRLLFVKWDAVEPLRFYYAVAAAPEEPLAFKTVQLGLTVDQSVVCSR